jgi:uncharacterized Zn-binding protein involved in type VI secretion
MPPVQRQGDPNDAGGIVSSGIASVRVNNIPVSVDGSPVSGHGRRAHSASSTANGITTVRAGGIPINTDGNADVCGHSRVNGSLDVRAGI